jgi:hypothetical protein
MSKERALQIIKKYSLGPGLLVKFKNDDKVYTTKNIHPDRERIFLTLNGLQTYCKKIVNLERIQGKLIESFSTEWVHPLADYLDDAGDITETEYLDYMNNINPSGRLGKNRALKENRVKKLINNLLKELEE